MYTYSREQMTSNENYIMNQIQNDLGTEVTETLETLVVPEDALRPSAILNNICKDLNPEGNISDMEIALSKKITSLVKDMGQGDTDKLQLWCTCRFLSLLKSDPKKGAELVKQAQELETQERKEYIMQTARNNIGDKVARELDAVVAASPWEQVKIVCPDIDLSKGKGHALGLLNARYESVAGEITDPYCKKNKEEDKFRLAYVIIRLKEALGT